MKLVQSEYVSPESHNPRASYLPYRRYLVDWMSDIGEQFNLHTTTIHTSVLFLDRIFREDGGRAPPPRSQWQLIATACISVASKYEEAEEHCPPIPELLEVTKLYQSGHTPLSFRDGECEVRRDETRRDDKRMTTKTNPALAVLPLHYFRSSATSTGPSAPSAPSISSVSSSARASPTRPTSGRAEPSSRRSPSMSRSTPSSSATSPCRSTPSSATPPVTLLRPSSWRAASPSISALAGGRTSPPSPATRRPTLKSATRRSSSTTRSSSPATGAGAPVPRTSRTFEEEGRKAWAAGWGREGKGDQGVWVVGLGTAAFCVFNNLGWWGRDVCMSVVRGEGGLGPWSILLVHLATTHGGLSLFP